MKNQLFRNTPDLKNTLEIGAYFIERLQELEQENPIVKNVRGKGLILAIELKKPGGEVVVECMENGFLINCIRQNVFRFLPPLNVTRKDINSLMPVLHKSLIRLSTK